MTPDDYFEALELLFEINQSILTLEFERDRLISNINEYELDNTFFLD